MTTETAIPTVFQAELAEVAEAGPAEEVGEGEAVGFQEVMAGTTAPIDDETARVPGEEDRTRTDLVDDDEVGVLAYVDETVDDAEETVVIGPSGGKKISPRLGKRVLEVVGVA